MEIKFFRIKDTEIRKAVRFDDDGNRNAVVALIGRAGELVEKGVLTVADARHDPERWVVLPCEAGAGETMALETYTSLPDAKQAVKTIYNYGRDRRAIRDVLRDACE